MDIDTEHTHLGIPFSKTELYCIGEHDSKRLLFLFFLYFFFLWCLIFVNESTVELLMLLVVQ